MTMAGQKILQGLTEALAVARGEALPAGVYHLSKESIETLRRARERADKLAARHLKLVS